MPRVFVAPTGRTGNGLFAGVPFAAGETILAITGTVTTSTYDSHYRVGPRWIGIGECTWLVPTPRSDASYLNQSCDANAVISWGKLAVDTPTFMIESDATIVAPLLFAVVLGL